MGSADDIAGTQATNKSPKHNAGVHLCEVTGACTFKSGQTDQDTYVVECIVINHDPVSGVLKQEAGTIVGWAQPADKNHKPAIKAFTVSASKALAVAKKQDPNAVKEAMVTGEVIRAMFPTGNENKDKSLLRGLRFITTSTPKQSDKGPWTLTIWQHAPEQPSYVAAKPA